MALAVSQSDETAFWNTNGILRRELKILKLERDHSKQTCFLKKMEQHFESRTQRNAFLKQKRDSKIWTHFSRSSEAVSIATTLHSLTSCYRCSIHCHRLLHYVTSEVHSSNRIAFVSDVSFSECSFGKYHLTPRRSFQLVWCSEFCVWECRLYFRMQRGPCATVIGFNKQTLHNVNTVYRCALRVGH